MCFHIFSDIRLDSMRSTAGVMLRLYHVDIGQVSWKSWEAGNTQLIHYRIIAWTAFTKFDPSRPHGI